VPEFREREGLWRLWVASAELAGPALALARVQSKLAAPSELAAPAELDGVACDYEHEFLRWTLGGLPHATRRAGLEWLRARAFLAPRPLASGGLYRAGLARYSFLVTQRVLGAVTLLEFLAQADDPLRAEVLEELARETARLHALQRVLPEPAAAQVQVERAGTVGRVYFLDCRPGMVRPGALAGLTHSLAHSERERFLEHYADELAAQLP